MNSLKFSFLISLLLFGTISAEDKGICKFRIGRDFTNGILKKVVSSSFESLNNYTKNLTTYSWNYGSLVSFDFTNLTINPLIFDEKEIAINYSDTSITLEISIF